MVLVVVVVFVVVVLVVVVVMVVVVVVVVYVVCPFWKEILVQTLLRSIWQYFALSDGRKLITCKEFYRNFMNLCSTLSYRT
jgi:hypothetical protein